MSPPEAALPGYEVLGSGPASSDQTSEKTNGDGWLLAVRIPEASPLFAGHFPGHPILPGVAQLALVTRALHDWRGPGMAVSGVRSLKLRRPVGPGDTLTVRLSAGDGAVGFIIERGSEMVSRGTVLTREAAAWR
jgi:3-hydroxymyristoyl/3-hydroxydecanoyl-(acyl carrier protein) dehydratase